MRKRRFVKQPIESGSVWERFWIGNVPFDVAIFPNKTFISIPDKRLKFSLSRDGVQRAILNLRDAASFITVKYFGWSGKEFRLPKEEDSAKFWIGRNPITIITGPNGLFFKIAGDIIDIEPKDYYIRQTIESLKGMAKFLYDHFYK